MSLYSMQHLYVSAWAEAEGTIGKHEVDPWGIINHKRLHKVILAMPFGVLNQSKGISAHVEDIFVLLIHLPLALGLY